MKVCAVTTWPPHKDGVALYSAELYGHIAELVDVQVIANIPEKPHQDRKVNGRNVKRSWKRGSCTYPFSIYHSTLKEKPNIVHFQHGWLLYGGILSSPLFIILLIFYRLARKPFLVTMHTVIRRDAHIYEGFLSSLLARVIVFVISRFIVKVSDKVIVHNHMMKKYLQKEYGLQEEEHKIVVIPHGVRKASEKPEESQKNRNRIILSIGFIRKNKGIEQLIMAFRKFIEEYPDSNLIIVGGHHAHDTAENVEKFRNVLTPNLSKRVSFTGFIDEKSLDKLIETSDMIVLSSLDRYYIESSGVLARVADFGKPIICSRVPKFESELEDGVDCIMIEPGDPEAIAKALFLLMENVQIKKKIGENLRRKFKNRYWSDMAEEHYMLYRSMLNLSDKRV